MRRALVLLLLAACDGPPQTVLNACIPGWPAARQVTLAQPLTAQPAVLWKKPITGGISNDWIVANDGQLAFTAGGRLYILDHDGNLLGVRGGLALERVSSPVLLPDGAYAFAGASGYVVGPDAAWRAIVPLPGAQGTTSAGKQVALSPDGSLVFGAADGAVHALDATTGVQRWASAPASSAPSVRGGIGQGVLVSAADADAWDVIDATSGKGLQKLPEGEQVIMAGPTLGLVTQRMQAMSGGHYPWMHLTLRDQCGAPRWTLPAEGPQWPTLIGQDDRLYVVSRDDTPQSPTRVSVYSADGALLVGPTPAAIPWALGADGTLYGVRCDSPGHEGPSHLTAYDGLTLEEKWSLDLGNACPAAGPIIDAQGRLYFTWYSLETWATELVAVQTTSPGLMPSAWPTRKVDATGAAWVH